MKRPRKLNRRTNWKFARDRVKALFSFDPDFPTPASFGPAGRSKRFFTYFGGVDSTTITAKSEAHYWERMDRHTRDWSAAHALESYNRLMEKVRAKSKRPWTTVQPSSH